MSNKDQNRNSLILDFIKENPNSSSSEIHEVLKNKLSYATVKRSLQQLSAQKLLSISGKGRGTKYFISEAYDILRPIDVTEYFKKEIDERKIKAGFNFTLIKKTLSKIDFFSDEESNQLKALQNKYKENISKLTKAEYQKELERLAIDLSWKSSQIEGNTYSLLETERLLKEKETASGKTKDEASMLLNHKSALDFIIQHPDYVKPLTIKSVEDVHSMLVEDLGIARNIRKRRVGISGTNYRPLDNEFQIKEALEDMCSLVNKEKNIFSKALIVLILLSYIQAFNDGNKRTARIISNAILMNNNYCPISFRTVDSIDYKKAMLVFYEQNNITPFKRIFINQFAFAVETYF
ncbi:MAG: Fic family protein [Bacteroidetes bacterium]|nr:Fic family protein [Bacteroidota bacterium]